MGRSARSLRTITIIAAAVAATVVPFALAHAADDNGLPSVGSVGNLASATLQTAGVYAQAQILSEFKDGLRSLAALCYLGALTSAIASVAIYGTYRKGLYLLIGPMFFYFAIEKTADANGTLVQVGDRVITGSIQDQIQFMKKHATSRQFDGAAKVSRIFLIVDNMVSAIVQDLVEVIAKPSTKEDLRRKARERVIGWMYRATPHEPGFLKLVSILTTGWCGEEFGLLMGMRHQMRDPKQGVANRRNLTPRGAAMYDEWVKRKDLKKLVFDQDIRMFLLGTQHSTQAEWQGSDTYTCQTGWNLLWERLQSFAKNRMDIRRAYLREHTGAVADQVIPWGQVEADVRAALAGELPNSGTAGAQAANILAGYVLKNMMGKTAHGLLASQITEHADFNAERRTFITEDIARAEAYGGFLKVVYFAGALPYIQGVLLYLLSCAFPFFAVFLVMPSRATTFFVWMSLWVWVKSWDVGFAMVSVIRGILWGYVTDAPNPGRAEIVGSDPSTVFSIVFMNDPLATMNTYNQVIAFFTVSVPIFSAHACLGATNLYDAFKMSIDQTANRFGQMAANKAKRKLASRMQQEYGLRRAQAAFDAQKRYFGGIDSFGHGYKKLDDQGGAGLSTRDNHLLRNTGDASRSEMMRLIGTAGAVEWAMSKEGRTRAARLAAATGRVVSQLNGTGAALNTAYAQALGLSFTAQDKMTGHFVQAHPLFQIGSTRTNQNGLFGASAMPGMYELNRMGSPGGTNRDGD